VLQHLDVEGGVESDVWHQLQGLLILGQLLLYIIILVQLHHTLPVSLAEWTRGIKKLP
jgi:hypothetical protein